MWLIKLFSSLISKMRKTKMNVSPIESIKVCWLNCWFEWIQCCSQYLKLSNNGWMTIGRKKVMKCKWNLSNGVCYSNFHTKMHIIGDWTETTMDLHQWTLILLHISMFANSTKIVWFIWIFHVVHSAQCTLQIFIWCALCAFPSNHPNGFRWIEAKECCVLVVSFLRIHNLKFLNGRANALIEYNKQQCIVYNLQYI